MTAQNKIPIDFDEEISDDSESKSINNDTDNFHENVSFPLTQNANTSGNNTSTSTSSTKLLKQAELSRRVFLYLIEKYNLSPSVILHSLYVTSGNVSACERYLSDAKMTAPWSLEEDHLILTDADVTKVIGEKGLEALNERRTFLHQVCYEAIGTSSEIASKLK